MLISNTLLRAALLIHQVESQTDNYQIFQIQEDHKYRREIEETDMEEVLFVTDRRLDRIRCETTNDAALQTLMSTIKDGWPDSKAAVPLCIRDYWPYRDSQPLRVEPESSFPQQWEQRWPPELMHHTSVSNALRIQPGVSGTGLEWSGRPCGSWSKMQHLSRIPASATKGSNDVAPHSTVYLASGCEWLFWGRRTKLCHSCRSTLRLKWGCKPSWFVRTVPDKADESHLCNTCNSIGVSNRQWQQLQFTQILWPHKILGYQSHRLQSASSQVEWKGCISCENHEERR